jgi:hypothetical protein
MRQVDLEYRGKQISAALNQAGKEPPMWYLSFGGTALTKLPAQPADTDQAVRSRVVAWLEAHPDLLDRDQIVLGGG